MCDCGTCKNATWDKDIVTCIKRHWEETGILNFHYSDACEDYEQEDE